MEHSGEIVSEWDGWSGNTHDKAKILWCCHVGGHASDQSPKWQNPKILCVFLLRHVMLPLLFGSLEVCRSYRFKAHLVDCKQLLHNPQ